MCIYKIPPPTHTTDQTKLLAQTYSLLKSFSYSTHFFLPSHRLSSSGIHPDQALVCTRAISKCLPTICSSERSRKSLGILGSVYSVMDAFLVSLNWLGARFPPARVLGTSYSIRLHQRQKKSLLALPSETSFNPWQFASGSDSEVLGKMGGKSLL